jgi:hypothetical protein
MSKERIPLKEKQSVEFQKLPLNENYVVMGLRAMTAGESKKGASAVKYYCLAECTSTNRVLIQVFSFNEELGVQDLKKGQRFFVRGKINYYRHPKTRKEYHSLFVEELELNK